MQIGKIGAYAAKIAVEQLEDTISSANWALRQAENSLKMVQKLKKSTKFRPSLTWYLLANKRRKKKIKENKEIFESRIIDLKKYALEIKGLESEHPLPDFYEEKIQDMKKQMQELTETDKKHADKNPEEKVKRIELSELLDQPFKKTAVGILLWYPEYRILSWIFYVCVLLIISFLVK